MSTPDEAELCYPHLGNSSCRRIVRSHSVSVLLHIILSSISVLTVTLNLLVIISISHFRKLHTPTNFLLLSLAVSDFSVGFVWVFMIFLINGCWFLGAGWCVFHSVLGSVATAVSIGTVVLISVDRYVAVCDPMHYQTKVTKTRAKMCIILCWAGSTIFHCLKLKSNIENPGQFDSCTGECMIYIHPVAEIVNVVLSFFIPFSIIVVLYVRVFIVAVSQAQAMRSHVTVVTLQSSLKVNRSELKAARALGVVVVVFLMCLTPFYLVVLTTGFGVKSPSSYIFVIGLFFFNSLLNPVIYVFLYPWFRKCVKCVFSLQILKSGSSEANIL
ncbi:trace amine-associated receptor 13c-like [Gouania willdenowi]|uniref:trace amine-associated receptor 13c-like n=1 Tax=Gouania willdenowi TaxID=441366 RepID=UPI0010555BA0|nr:trace amine-associated receptor 13c-like [Gouania willdenowi]XP_028298001.1 trace amine-associated receptor 13c-like [Gouania willdenowi]